jgi:sec-independent protein translocase protein TatB
MFGLGLPELLIIGLVAFVIFGPERLPTLARDAGRMLRQLKAMADNASSELRSQIPNAAEYGLDDIQSLSDLHPKRVLTRAMFDSDDAPDLLEDGTGSPARAPRSEPTAGAAASPAPVLVAREAGAPPPYDLDAT